MKVIELYKQLAAEKEYVISKKLLRSATSIGANVEEASTGQSKKDFIAKMSIASKEAREGRYRLRLMRESSLTKIEMADYLKQVAEISKILTSIVKTSIENESK